MQTIQEVIKNTDPKAIEDAYFYTYPVKLWEVIKSDDLKIGEFKKRLSKKFQSFLKRLCDMEVTSNENILFLYKSLLEETIPGKDMGLIHKDELLREEDMSKVCIYAFEFTEQAETLGFLVSDNKFTQNHLMDLIVSFLHEISFFGFEQEYLEEEKTKLEKSFEEYKEETEIVDVKDFFKEMHEKYGIPEDEEYPDENEKRSKYHIAAAEYTQYCRNIELTRIKEQIEKEVK